jgi:hypothetical protein
LAELALMSEPAPKTVLRLVSGAGRRSRPILRPGFLRFSARALARSLADCVVEIILALGVLMLAVIGVRALLHVL